MTGSANMEAVAGRLINPKRRVVDNGRTSEAGLTIQIVWRYRITASTVSGSP